MAVHTFADQTHRYDTAWPMSYTSGPWRGLLHSTEGLTLPGYLSPDGRKGGSAPHFTLRPNIAAQTSEIFQHFDTSRPSRALASDPNIPGETNREQVVQIELVGTTDSAKRSTWTLGTRTYRAGVDYIYWPEAPRWVLDDLARLMRWIEAAHGIPRVSTPRPWLLYPASYGKTAARMTAAEWDSFAGWCSHMHAPENLHGDVLVDIAYLLQPDQSEEDDDMTPEQAAQLARVENLLLTGRPDRGLGSPEWPYPFSAVAATLVAAQTGAKGIDPATIAAAIPDDIARDVADELAKRLGSP